MASTPAFPSLPRVGILNTATANTNRDGSGTIGTVITGAAAPGTVINRVVIKAEDDLADGIIILYLSNDGGTTWFLFDEIDTGDGTNASNTDPGYRYEKAYSDLFLPSASYKLGAAPTVAPTTGDVNIFAFGGDLT